MLEMYIFWKEENRYYWDVDNIVDAWLFSGYNIDVGGYGEIK